VTRLTCPSTRWTSTHIRLKSRQSTAGNISGSSACAGVGIPLTPTARTVAYLRSPAGMRWPV
jgi:hypothetical protein